MPGNSKLCEVSVSLVDVIDMEETHGQGLQVVLRDQSDPGSISFLVLYIMCKLLIALS